MALSQAGDKPLLKPVMTQYNDVYIDGLVQEKCNSSACFLR